MTLSGGTADVTSKSSGGVLSSLRRILKDGILKRTGSSYIALFRPLQDAQSRAILFCAVVLAIAAGAPLPIIGVIFARIIDSFPPSEEEIRTRISQLLAVGESIYYGLYLCFLFGSCF
jgi:ATP-binding cassette subfamily B (MDR/TAP) protein 1